MLGILEFSNLYRYFSTWYFSGIEYCFNLLLETVIIIKTN